MGSKRSKKSKQELDIFVEKGNMKKNEENGLLRADVSNISHVNDNVITSSVTKAPKRKKKNEDNEEVPEKVKKTSDNEGEVKKVKVKKKKVKNENEFELNGTDENKDIVDQKNKSDSPDKKKEQITWPDQDIIELINRMEANIPEKDILAYRSRIEKLDWKNVAFNNYTSEECKKTWILVQKKIRRFRLLREILSDAREWVNTPKTNHKISKPKKHPDMPRRPLSSYLLFYLKKKDEIISENPGLDASDLTKLVGQIYKNLPPEKREKYEKLAASNKEEYLEKLKIFFETHPEFAPPAKFNHKTDKTKVDKEVEKVPTKIEKSLKVEKDKTPKIDKDKTIKILKDKSKGDKKPGRPPRTTIRERPPKKFQTPFGLFYNSELKNLQPGMDKTAFKEKCKQQYRQMSDKKKVYWIEMAEQDLIRYQEEVKAYKAKFPNFKVHNVKSILTKHEKASKERAAGKPTKPPNSAYALYSKVMLQSDEIKSVHPKDRMNFIANKWKTCSEEEQSTYKDRVVHLMEEYRQAYQAYVDSLPEEEKNKIQQVSKNKKNKGRTATATATAAPPPPPPPAAAPAPNKKILKKPEKETPVKTKFSEPEQPPISACKYFSSLYKGDGDPVQAWKALSIDEKRKYEEDLVKKKQAYIVEFEKFLKSLSKEELEAFSKSRQQQIQSEDDETSECSSDSDDDNEDDDEDVEPNENDHIHNNEDIGHDSDTD